MDNRKARIAAISGTVLIFVAVLLLMWGLKLRYTGNEERKWPPEDTSELLFDGEYVKVGDVPRPETEKTPMPAASEPESTPETDDLRDQGPAAPEPAPVVSSEQESAMKVEKKPVPEKTGPTKEELEAIAKAKKQDEARKKISRRVKFGGDRNGSSSAGESGSPKGNAAEGALSGAPGTNLKGRTLASWSKPSGTETGTITITVRVNRKGEVVSASYSSGTGAIASSAAARESCRQAAMKSRFSVDLDAVPEQVGTITYRFE